MAKYEILKGDLVCHTCKTSVHSMRWYISEKELSWMCKDGHVSIVSLVTKKKKGSYEREIGE